MLRKDKKGFSLVELLVTITILGVLSALLVPSLTKATYNNDEKTDKAAISNLQLNIQTAFQNSAVYKNAKEIADYTASKTINVVYEVDDNDTLVLSHLEAATINDGVVTSEDEHAIGIDLELLKEDISGYINGKIDPIILQSEHYKETGHCYTVQFTDIDFQVSMSSGEQFVIATNSTLGAPGLYDGAYEDGTAYVMPSGGSIHIHTGYNGLAENKAGDIWKITLTGSGLSNMNTTFSEYKNNSWNGTSNVTVTNKKTEDNLYEIYVAYNTKDTCPIVAFKIQNTRDEARISSIQITKVNQ